MRQLLVVLVSLWLVGEVWVSEAQADHRRGRVVIRPRSVGQPVRIRIQPSRPSFHYRRPYFGGYSGRSYFGPSRSFYSRPYYFGPRRSYYRRSSHYSRRSFSWSLGNYGYSYSGYRGDGYPYPAVSYPPLQAPPVEILEWDERELRELVGEKFAARHGLDPQDLKVVITDQDFRRSSGALEEVEAEVFFTRGGRQHHCRVEHEFDRVGRPTKYREGKLEVKR